MENFGKERKIRAKFTKEMLKNLSSFNEIDLNRILNEELIELKRKERLKKLERILNNK